MPYNYETCMLGYRIAKYFSWINDGRCECATADEPASYYFVLGIYMLDSIIIGRGEYYSFAEAGKLDSNND